MLRKQCWDDQTTLEWYCKGVILQFLPYDEQGNDESFVEETIMRIDKLEKSVVTVVSCFMEITKRGRLRQETYTDT